MARTCIRCSSLLFFEARIRYGSHSYLWHVYSMTHTSSHTLYSCDLEVWTMIITYVCDLERCVTIFYMDSDDEINPIYQWPISIWEWSQHWPWYGCMDVTFGMSSENPQIWRTKAHHQPKINNFTWCNLWNRKWRNHSNNKVTYVTIKSDSSWEW